MNPTVETLLNRRSVPYLDNPAPNFEQLEILLRCALRAADHGNLKPWRFIYLEGNDRIILSQAMLQAGLEVEPDMAQYKKDKLMNKVYRAPAILIAVSRNIEHPKVPVIEQQMATSAAVQNILNAAYSLNIGAYWRTGASCLSKIVKKALNIEVQENIVGFIYLGKEKHPGTSKSTDDWRNCLQMGIVGDGKDIRL